MSATKYYLEKGGSPTWKTVVVSESGTIKVWDPTASTRIVLTDVSVGANLAGTVAFYFGDLGGDKIFEFWTAGSATISPNIGVRESNVYDRELYFAATPGSTNGFVVNVGGFEMPIE